MATKNNNTVSTERMEKLVAFVRQFNTNENRGCPQGAIEYVGGFSKSEVKATKTAGMIVSGKGSEGGFYPAGAKPVAKGPTVKVTVKNRMATYLRMLVAGHTLNELDIKLAEDILRDYDRQNEKRTKSSK